MQIHIQGISLVSEKGELIALRFWVYENHSYGILYTLFRISEARKHQQPRLFYVTKLL